MLNLDIGLYKNFYYPFILADIQTPIIGANFLDNFEILVDIKNKQLIDSSTNKKVRGFTGHCDLLSLKINMVENKYSYLLNKYPSIFMEPDYNKPIKHSTEHRIETKGLLPYCRPRRLDPIKSKIAKDD